MKITDQKIIQLVPMKDGFSIFLIAFKDGVLWFRNSLSPEYLQNEQIKIDANTVYTNLLSFPRKYLEKFIHENN